MATQRNKNRQKQGVKFLKVNQLPPTVNPATWRIEEDEADLKLSKTLANAQLAQPAGLHGRFPPLRDRRHGTPICASILSVQESAPLLTEGNTC